jgi:D-alanyl-D-alanine carboxypeptidase/D-alanyl-D-alanine-endopeptidase (penicillin-binding protein 4)
MVRIAAVSFALLFALGVGQASAATSNQVINSWIARSSFAGSHTSLLVYDKTANRFLGVHNATTTLKPGSNMKLLTSAASLLRFGVTGRLATSAMTGGSLNGSTLNGNLWLVGGGDPSFSTRLFSAKAWGGSSGRLDILARAVRAAGITRITGDIIGDESKFDSRRTAPFWKADYWRDCPPITALSVNMDLWTFGQPEAAPYPAQHAARLFRSALIGAGVSVGGGARQAVRPSSVHVVATDQSPAMSRLVRQMDKQSVNFYAEVLTKDLAVRGGRTGTTANGVRAIRNAVHDLGLAYPQARIYDGSGLSTGDRLSAAEILGLLRNVGTRGWSAFYRDALPVAGVDGTLAQRMRTGPAHGNVRAKTGTLDDASALSGYLNSRNGHRIIFSMIMNRTAMNVLAAHKLQDRIAQYLAGSRPS